MRKKKFHLPRQDGCHVTVMTGKRFRSIMLEVLRNNNAIRSSEFKRLLQYTVWWVNQSRQTSNSLAKAGQKIEKHSFIQMIIRNTPIILLWLCSLYHVRPILKLLSKLVNIFAVMFLTFEKIYSQTSNIRRICRRCSNYIYILDSSPDFNGFGRNNCNTRRETFKF